MAKKSVSKGEKKEKKPREPKEKKSVFPMPFVAELTDIAGCQGLAYNRGLFTQCTKKRMENGNYCKGCQTEADKNASGCPDCGTVESRLATGLYEFKDPKGRSPISYVKVLEKLKLSVLTAEEESGKLHIDIPEEHFVVVEKSKKASVARGRPKKTGAVEADNVTDLFAKLSSEGEGEDEVIEDGEDKPVKASSKQTKAKLSDEEKAAKKAALEEERAVKKAEREAKLALEKAEREEKRKAEAELKKQEREAKLAAEKAEREAKRLAEKAERDAKKAAEKAEKEAAKSSKGKKSAAKEETKAAPEPVVKPAAAPAPAPAKVSVSRIQIAGKAYLKSSTNILYDPNTKEEVGLWDPESKTIKELPEEDDEEEEEDYESDA
jgi:hypothetical protein